MLIFLLSSRDFTRFVLSVAEMLRGKSFSIWVLWVRRESGVQVCAKHVHEDLKTQSKCWTKHPIADYMLMSLLQSYSFDMFQRTRSTAKWPIVCKTHSTVSGEVSVPLSVLQVTTTIPAKRAHTATVGQF